MGEFMELISDVKKDKNKFDLVINKMEPLINKYVRLLYKDESEDMRSELIIALWEGVCNISFYENDGQIVNFLKIALRNRYLELYKSSKRYHDHKTDTDDNQELLENLPGKNNSFDEVLVKINIEQILNTYYGSKKDIVYLILVDDLSDSEIAAKLNISRQYINRVRRNLREQMKAVIGYGK